MNAVEADNQPGPKSLNDVDPELRTMFHKFGISLAGQERLAGVAGDAFVDPVSVVTTSEKKLAEVGHEELPLPVEG